ncbi:MAG TPA: sigma-70 family RNA polymerase sigma factor [Myxococcota bacterium]|nr:sigma-70 family RNA polymerase sigma factor [Myxococcota bacterium]
MAKQYRRRKSESATATPSKRAKLAPTEAPGKAFAGKAGEAVDAAAGKRRGKKRRDEDEGPASGFISEADVRAKSRANNLQDIEPTAEDLASEQALIDGVNRKGKRQTPAPGKDLLASYMEQLSHIPLFTPEQELANARELETLELTTWRLILEAPKAVIHLGTESTELEPTLRAEIETLNQAYSRAAARTRKKKLGGAPSRDKAIEKMAAALRFADFDKELLDRVMARVRRDVWGRRVLSANPAFRLTHADLTDIEKARGTALRARNNFVRANLRLVVSVARNFHHYRIPFIDLIQEGNVGLMKAVHRFDHGRGFRFSTYAHWWIRQSIERAIINKGSQVRLPVHVIDSRRQVGRATAKLTQRLGRAPTSGEISKSVKMPAEKVEQILSGIQQDPVSLDETVSGDDPRKFLDLVRDENVPALDEALIRENTHERVRELLHLLNPIEKDIIRRRFGLGNDTDQTLDEIGKLYNLSRERVRQIQAQGLMKMRRMCERRKIS